MKGNKRRVCSTARQEHKEPDITSGGSEVCGELPIHNLTATQTKRILLITVQEGWGPGSGVLLVAVH